MTYRNVLTASAVLSFLFGLGFVLLPAQLVRLYNVQLTPSGTYLAQLYGANLLGFAVLNWFARQFGEGSAQRSVLTANLLTALLATIFSLIAQLGGVPGANALGWSTVILYLAFTLGFGYLRLMRS